MWSHIVETHGGRLPLRISAWDEGCRVPVGYPSFTVVNTDPRCEALTNHVEALLCKVWYPMTVATISGYVIEALGTLVTASGGPAVMARYMLHDFGYRGASSEETARIGGMAHLVHSQGTDTLQAMKHAAHYYGAPLQDLASSVVASEHSIMTAGGPQEEIAIARHIIETHPDQIISLVADSYDYYSFVDAMIDLKPIVDQHRVKLVIRPDSITPRHNDPKDLVLWTLNRYAARMPYTSTPTGHKETPYAVLWGDGLVPDKIIEIATAVVADGFAAHNTVYGMGGGLLQKVDRDTERFAIKSSAQERNGQWVNVQKKPLDTSKASLTGRLQVVNLDGRDEIVPEEQWPDPLDPRVRLKPVFENGVILREHTFEQVRARARAGDAMAG
jgi:nicotinamide phosphoribosyltransferase